jgi:hypothetical protein
MREHSTAFLRWYDATVPDRFEWMVLASWCGLPSPVGNAGIWFFQTLVR